MGEKDLSPEDERSEFSRFKSARAPVLSIRRSQLLAADWTSQSLTRQKRPIDLFAATPTIEIVSMNSKAAVGVVAILVVVGGVAGAFALGVIPGTGGNGSSGSGAGGGGGGDATETYESTVVVDDSGSEGASTANSQPPFSFVIENIKKCGQRCRNVTASITNNQNETATGVTVRSEIYTGSNYNNKIWQSSSDAGELAPGESYTDNKQVELGYSEAYAVQQNDGEILIKTYIVTDDQTFVFKDERDVL